MAKVTRSTTFGGPFVLLLLGVALVMSFFCSGPNLRVLTINGGGNFNKVSQVSCNSLLQILPRPVMMKKTKANQPFKLAVADPMVDTAISAGVVTTGLWDVHVLKALEDAAGLECKEGAIAMDVGANLGFFTNALLAMGCRVNAFEMQPEMAERVVFSACNNGNLDRLTMHLGAVSDESATLYTVDPRRGNLGGVSVRDDATLPVPVQAKRIDDIMGLHTQVAVMKMDVEGHEHRALKGMEKMFQNRLVQNIVMEFTPNTLGLEAATDMLNYLYSYGFTSITELDYMSAREYKKHAKRRTVDTLGDDWARRFTTKIMEGGDSRGEKFTDLWLTLE